MSEQSMAFSSIAAARDTAFVALVLALMAASGCRESPMEPDEAWLTESQVFDLTLVKNRYREFYGPGPGRIALDIEGVSGRHLLYEFDG